MSGHGGNLDELARRAGCPAGEILDFSANINPLGMPERLRPVLSRRLDDLANYPDPEMRELTAAIEQRYGVPARRLVIANGSSEILYALARAAGLSRAVIPVPSYGDYAQAARAADMAVETIAMAEAAGLALDFNQLAQHLRGGEIVFLGQPNNPTGLLFDNDQFLRLVRQHAETTFVVDEAFAEFVAGYRSLLCEELPNLIVLRSLTKFYAIPGLRLGFAAASEEWAAKIRGQIPTWSVNTLAQAAGTAMLADKEYAQKTVALVTQQREALTGELAILPGLDVVPGRANFLLVRIDGNGLDAPALAEAMLRRRIAIRVCDNFEGLGRRYFRVAVRTAEENERLVNALRDILQPSAPRPAPKRRAMTLMFQGTSSNAGKSLLTAALCRILLQDGLRVAPFKSQNMSLNSYVTRDGGEMGRAQAVQAAACRIECDVRMNPILLKPNSDTGCQVIVRGKPVGNMNVAKYIDYKPQAFDVARECFDSLAAEFDAVILEGAGSPGEVNLKSHDIVNMAMARHAHAPVLVVGDIDRGGVYASFVGTMEVLSAWERAMVAGWVVNRFRGDASLLATAHDYVLGHTGRPVLGVVPYLPDLNIPQEDSVEFKNARGGQPVTNGEAVTLAVIDLPHISNFTDLDAFAGESDVRVRIIRRAEDLDDPDAILLPGSKNTLADLAYLKRSGLAARIAAAADKAEIVGVCGGFQMLGRRISDPQCIESSAGGDGGLGLLPVETIMGEEKTLTRVEAKHAPSGQAVRGYEIHHGQTNVAGGESLQATFVREDGTPVGLGRRDHRVWGTYLHGVFDADGFRRWFIDRLRIRRGLPPRGAGGAYDIEPALDRLAAVVRHSLDMNEIYRLMKSR